VASCRNIENQLQAYIDGEAGESGRVAVEEHLAGCARCARLHRQHQRAAVTLFETLNPFRLQSDLTGRVMAHLPEMELEAVVEAREATYRAKHPRGRFSLVRRLLPVLAPVFIFVLGLAIIYSWPAEQAAPGEAVGVVTLSSGDVLLRQGGMRVQPHVEARTHVFSGQSFETAGDAHMMLALAGPSEVRLDANSLVHVRGARELQLDHGRAWIHVDKGVSLFRVSTPAGNVVVFGTTFDVRVERDLAVVTVKEGMVHVENGVASRDVTGGQQLTLRRGQTVLLADNIDARETLSWARGMVADGGALHLFAETIRSGAGENMAAEQAFVVQTNGRTVRQISFEWEAGSKTQLAGGYYVYVSDDHLNLLFVERIPGTVFADAGRTSIDITAPGDGISGVNVLHIKAVPAGNSDARGTSFTRVSALGI
jgi:hypothetical protein